MPQYDIFSEALPNTVALSTDDKTYVGSFHKSMLWHFPIIPPYMLMPRLIETAGEAYPTNFKGLLPYFVRQLGKHIYQIQKGSDELVENLYGWLQEFAPNDEDIDEQIEQLALLSICALQCYMLGQTLSFLAIGKTDFILAKIERLSGANLSPECRNQYRMVKGACYLVFWMYPWAHLKLPDREFESPSIDYVASILGYNQARIFLSQLCSLKNPLSSQCIRDSSDLIIFDQTLRLFCELLLITNLPMVQTVVLADSILCTIHKMKGFRRRLYFIHEVKLLDFLYKFCKFKQLDTLRGVYLATVSWTAIKERGGGVRKRALVNTYYKLFLSLYDSQTRDANVAPSGSLGAKLSMPHSDSVTSSLAIQDINKEID